MKHPPVKKTIKRGLRLAPQHKIADSPQNPAEEMVRWVKKVLTDGQLLPEDEKSFLN